MHDLLRPGAGVSASFDRAASASAISGDVRGKARGEITVYDSFA
jgi:hypothetical protein